MKQTKCSNLLYKNNQKLLKYLLLLFFPSIGTVNKRKCSNFHSKNVNAVRKKWKKYIVYVEFESENYARYCEPKKKKLSGMSWKMFWYALVAMFVFFSLVCLLHIINVFCCALVKRKKHTCNILSIRNTILLSIFSSSTNINNFCFAVNMLYVFLCMFTISLSACVQSASPQIVLFDFIIKTSLKYMTQHMSQFISHCKACTKLSIFFNIL